MSKDEKSSGPGWLVSVLVALVLTLGGVVLFLLAYGRNAPAPSVSAPPASAPAAAPAVQVPAAFQGEWNANLAHCGTDVNEARLTIVADRIAFYEASGPITGVRIHAPDEVTLEARLTGEGETFTATHRFRLSEDESELIEVTEAAGLTRYRCPLRG